MCSAPPPFDAPERMPKMKSLIKTNSCDSKINVLPREKALSNKKVFDKDGKHLFKIRTDVKRVVALERNNVF